MLNTWCPKCGWYYASEYMPVGSVCDNTAQLPLAYKARLAEEGKEWPACKGIIVKVVKKTLDRDGESD